MIDITTNPEPRSLETFSSKQSNKNYILSLECNTLKIGYFIPYLGRRLACIKLSVNDFFENL